MKEPNPHELLTLMAPQESHAFLLEGWAGDGAVAVGIAPTKTQEFSAHTPPNKLKAILNNWAIEYPHTQKRSRGFWGGVVALLGYQSLEGAHNNQQKSLNLPVVHIAQYPVIARFAAGEWQVVGAVQKFPQISAKLHSYIAQARQLKAKNQLATRDIAPISAEMLVSAANFQKSVTQALAQIKAGHLWEINLAHPLHLHSSEPVAQLYQRIATHSPAPWAAFYQAPNFAVLSNSPEILLGSAGAQIWTKPIAGTRPRHSDPQQDAELKRKLQTSFKDRAEHLMTVDVLRNDLGQVATPGTIVADPVAAVETYQNVFHIVSTLKAQLEPPSTPIDALLAIFPGGSITGAPKKACLQQIAQLEAWERGFYTGSLGWIDASGDLEFNILIRTVQTKPTAAGWEGWLHVGAGMVGDSQPQKEWEETLHKANAWRQVFAGANGGN